MPDQLGTSVGEDRHAKMIMVVGMPSGGTSLVAGLLHHLGVDMGRFERGVPEGRRHYEGFECLDCWEGAISHAFDASQSQAFMQSVVQYIARRSAAAIGPFGVKHNPLLWLGMFDGIEQLPLRIVQVRRPLDEVMTSDRRYRGDDVARAARMGVSYLGMNRLVERIQPVLELTFAGIIQNPDQSVESLIEAFGLSPDYGQIESARDFVQPSMKHV